MPHTIQKPILVFLSCAAEDIDKAGATLAVLRSHNLWIDNLTDAQTIPKSYRKAVEIHLDDDFSLDVFLLRTKKVFEPIYDPALRQWMEHTKVVLNRLSRQFPAPRFFYPNGIPMNFSDGCFGPRTIAPPEPGRLANRSRPEAALANLDIELSIEVLSALLADDALADPPPRRVVSQGPTTVPAKAFLQQEFPVICERLRKRLGEDRFRLWLGALNFEDFDGECIRLSLPNAFLRNAITTYLDDILVCCSQTYANVRRVEILLRTSRPATKSKLPTSGTPRRSKVNRVGSAPARRNERGLSDWQTATVKSFSRTRSCAVLVGGQVPSNIFVDRETLQRCELLDLRRGQTLQVRWRETNGRRIAVELRPARAGATGGSGPA